MNSSTFRPPTGDVLNAERYCGAQRPPGIQDPDAVIGPVGSRSVAVSAMLQGPRPPQQSRRATKGPR
jgi:hypothetical protein